MGNCLFGSSFDEDSDGLFIKVIASNGAVMEFYPPISVSWIVDEFPNHAIFKQHDLFWTPLLRHEQLCPGQSYLLLDPFKSKLRTTLGHVRSNSLPENKSSANITVAPYNRMSVDCKSGKLARRASGNESRFWKVKLVISGEQLAGILSEAGPTEELIDNVRMVAKFGNGFSDKWSLSGSSRSASKNDSLVL